MTLAFLQVFRASVRHATIYRPLWESQMVSGVVRVGISVLVDSKRRPGKNGTRKAPSSNAVRFLCP